MINLDGLSMYVSATGDIGVVNADTILEFRQWGSRVLARYAGGRVRRGMLVGDWSSGRLQFRYCQREADGHLHAGWSWCDVARRLDGRIRITEHFTWHTRDGSGINVFEERTA